jgi:hypothetical protein
MTIPPESDARSQAHLGAGLQRLWGAPSQSVSNATVLGDLNQILIEHADTVILPQPAPFRSVYLNQVRQISPGQLEDRDSELNELAAFCLNAGQGSYAWWQAPAFAGKSALMAWFALHPPPGICVVSFFITARFKGQNNRGDFIDAVLGQLADLLGELPVADPWAGAREQHLVRMLGAAAERVAAAGPHERLVLLVDGLDEDRGVTAGPDAYSIAALLPARPPACMRVIVSGRPEPPVPFDVPEDHPLRDPGIVRRLAQSPRAAAVRDIMQRELRQLLHGSKTEQKILGLVAAAGGGLSAADLAELSGARYYKVEELLTTVAARSFTARESAWRYDAAPRVYLLGHEELQAMAAGFLGPGRLATYRKKIHAWAAGYRRRGWPEDTPEYLLRGYVRMLQELNDTGLLFAYATDWRRQDLIIRLSGGAGAALGEIATAWEPLLRSAEPALSATGRLAAHATILGGSRRALPMLPLVWALLGNWDRAVAAADAHADPVQRARELTTLAALSGRAGDQDWARRLADSAEAAAHAVADPEGRVQTLMSLVQVAAGVGDVDRARKLVGQVETAARTISDPTKQALWFVTLALVAAEASDRDLAKTAADQAEAAASTVADLHDRAELLASLAAKAAAEGEAAFADALFERAGAEAAAMPARDADDDKDTAPERGRNATLRQLTDAAVGAGRLAQAQTLAQWISDPSSRGHALAALAVKTGEVGDPELVSAILEQAEAAAHATADPDYQMQLLGEIAEAAARTGDMARATALATAVEAAALSAPSGSTSDQPTPLYWAAEAWIRAGDLARAQTLIGSLSDPTERDGGFGALCGAAVDAGDLERAASAARSITGDLFRRVWNLAIVAEAVARAGDRGLAATLADEAAAAARLITDPGEQSNSFYKLNGYLASALDLDGAEAAARAVTAPYPYVLALAKTAEGAVRAGDITRAQALAAEAGDAAHSVTLPGWRVVALTRAAQAAASSGCRDQALALAAAAAAVPLRDWAARSLSWDLGRMVEESSLSGDFFGAEMAARSIASPDDRAQVLAKVVKAALKAGDLDRAEEISEAIVDPDLRAMSRIDLVMEVARAGDLVRAEAIARAIPEPASQASALLWVAGAVADTGDQHRAEALAAQVQAIYRSGVGAARHPLAIDLSVYASDLGLLADSAQRVGDTERANVLARAQLQVIAQYRATPSDEAAAAGQPQLRGPGFSPPRGALPACDDGLPVEQPSIAALFRGGTGNGNDVPAGLVAFSREQSDASDIPASDDELDHDQDGTDPDDGDFAPPGAAAAEELVEPALKACKAGDIDRALALLGLAESRVALIIDLGDRAVATLEVVRMYALLGEIEHGRVLLGQFEAMAQLATDEEDQSFVTMMHALAAAIVDDLDRAEAIAVSAPDPWDPVSGLILVAEGLADPTIADYPQVPEGVFPRSARAWAISALSHALTLIARAEAAAMSIADLQRRAESLSSVTEAASELSDAADKAGDPDLAVALRVRAESAALSISSPKERARTLTDLASAADRARDGDRARSARAHAVTAAQALTEPDEKAEALARIASSAPAAQATSLLAQALHAAHWKNSLSALERVSPEAVAAIADEYLAVQALLPLAE